MEVYWRAIMDAYFEKRRRILIQNLVLVAVVLSGALFLVTVLL
jgi:hypothetical protein